MAIKNPDMHNNIQQDLILNTYNRYMYTVHIYAVVVFSGYLVWFMDVWWSPRVEPVDCCVVLC